MTTRTPQAAGTCSGRRAKVRFPTEYEAERAAARALERGATLYVYACPLCTGWHLSSQQSYSRTVPSRHQPRLHPCGREDTHSMHADCPGLVVPPSATSR